MMKMSKNNGRWLGQRNNNGVERCLLGTSWQQLKKGAAMKALLLPIFIFVFFSAILCGLFLAGWIDSKVFSPQNLNFPRSIRTPKLEPAEFRLNCLPKKANQTCPHHNYPTRNNRPINADPPSTCPVYFRWIHEDLRPWKETGVARWMVEKARKTAHFRVVILDGRVYVEKYRPALQTRDVFTLWGILQLSRWYPGRLPDLELMFDCDDRPVVRSKDFRRPNAGPPPLFRYCSDWKSLDIVFPDWSFWGWVETNIKPWANSSMDIRRGNKRVDWKDRVPYAYWRGNPYVCPERQHLLKCNLSQNSDWNTRLYIQDWAREAKEGYKQSNLEDQCTHRYKIYIEGWAWSVSEKYILACDSMTLLVRPRFHDFFTRGLVPLQHYWPVRDKGMCRSLKFAVEWGNNHTVKAQAIGKAGSDYIHNDVKMGYVYDYMFHLLNEYAKLLRFTPAIPPRAVELCPETIACLAKDAPRRFMVASLVKSPNDLAPCTLPPPYDPYVLKAFYDRYANLTRQVELWEDQYWASFNKNK
ncbi:hypothetical protein Nepgr_033145 [Nepenthes gracilis]|uniref:Glycosyl transferase CAP10 domain-containing protein n=1 Tax=Nepenthes gracilis TaxID=150966 RepID=A0AAD3Y6C6_NEPGR|nr:hypothetical protein Nepgr_033145 [Nepenthes gracilis]